MIKLKDIIKDSVIEPLLEEETYNLKSKKTGKIVTFTNKDNYKDALKGSDYEKPDNKGGEKEKGEENPDKLSGSDFDRETDKKDDDDAEFEKLMKMKDEIDDLDDKIQTLQMRYQTAASDERQQEIMDDITDTIEKKEELEDVYIKMNDEYHSK